MEARTISRYESQRPGARRDELLRQPARRASAVVQRGTLANSPSSRHQEYEDVAVLSASERLTLDHGNHSDGS